MVHCGNAIKMTETDKTPPVHQTDAHHVLGQDGPSPNPNPAMRPRASITPTSLINTDSRDTTSALPLAPFIKVRLLVRVPASSKVVHSRSRPPLAGRPSPHRDRHSSLFRFDGCDSGCGNSRFRVLLFRLPDNLFPCLLRRIRGARLTRPFPAHLQRLLALFDAPCVKQACLTSLRPSVSIA